VNDESPDTARIVYVRNIRKVATIVGCVALVSAAYFVYAFGLRVHPHRVGLACVIACVYVLVLAIVYSLVYRSQMAAARRM
jgi:lysylphosphatidylglycerol synthetase-like protein (DUF2156 family)